VTNPALSKIRIYPIKALDYVELSSSRISVHALQYDRQFAIMASDGRYVNGKRTGRVNQLKAQYDLKGTPKVRLSDRNSNQVEEFELRPGNEQLNEFLSDFFSMSAKLVESKTGDFHDIPIRSSASIVSQASLETLQVEMPVYSLNELRQRFRANLEITGVEAFWEELLCPVPNQGMRFTIGDVEFIAMAPRARCNVPPKNPLTGEMDKSFMQRMLKSRQRTLPENSRIPDFGNLYYLSVDAYLSKEQQGKSLAVDDEIQVFQTVSI